MGDLPVSPLMETLFEWQTVLQIMQIIVTACVFVFFVVAIGGIAWLAAHQNHKLSHNPLSLL